MSIADTMVVLRLNKFINNSADVVGDALCIQPLIKQPKHSHKQLSVNHTKHFYW